MSKLVTSRWPSVFGGNVFQDMPSLFIRPDAFGDLVRESSFPQVSFPRVDVRESDDSLSIIAEIPGMNKDDINVTVHEGRLILSGEQSYEKEDKRNGYLRREISGGSFKRIFTLPETVDVDKIEANYENGLLKIVFPKIEQAKPKQIEVRVR